MTSVGGFSTAVYFYCGKVISLNLLCS